MKLIIKKKLTCLPRSALAVKSSNSINTRCTIEASCAGTVVDVNGALRSGPAVDADTRETTDGVGTGCTVLAD